MKWTSLKKEKKEKSDQEANRNNNKKRKRKLRENDSWKTVNSIPITILGIITISRLK